MARLTLRGLRKLLAIAGVLLAVGAFFSLGHMIVATDPVQPAEAVFVLGGSRVNRSMEAVRLYREGMVRRILRSRGGADHEEAELARQGIHVPNDADMMRDLLVNRIGLPATAVVILPVVVDNTAQEAEAIRSMAQAERWTRLIVITDRASTRRAGFIFRRALGDGVQVMVTCNRNEGYVPGRWWATRLSFRSTFYEVPKLIVTWLGLRG